MERYDMLVIGNGVGGNIASKAAKEGYKTALVDKPPAGGTCQNYGCKPSKTLIHLADRLRSVQGLGEDGIEVKVGNIDLSGIMTGLRSTIKGWQEKQREYFLSLDNLDYYETEGRFRHDHTLETGEGVLKGEKIFIAAGARPFAPPVEGLEDVEYLTNESILGLESVPERFLVIGGGYIGVEYAHFMSQMGSEVTVIQRGGRLVPGLDSEVSEYLEERLSDRMEIALNTEAKLVERDGRGYKVTAGTGAGEEKEFLGDKILVAVGRRPNTDTLDLRNTGVETDERHYVKVDDGLRTTKENIWALGDIIGRAMFKHSGNLEAEIAWHNSKGGEKKSLDYDSVPNAVFTDPKIASVGLTESFAGKGHDIQVGRASYGDTVKGGIMHARGFAKVIVEKGSERLLGCHVIGPEAPLLIQEAVNVIALNGTVSDITTGIHIFPTLSRLIPRALKNLD